jgi:hypothetical protein
MTIAPEIKPTTGKSRCAACLPSSEADRRDFERYLRENHLADAVRFLSKDRDDLDAQVTARDFDRVVFFDLQNLLTMMWDHEPKIDEWGASGVRIELVRPEINNSTDWLTLANIVHGSLGRWRKRHRRRRVIAAALLSLIALAAIATLLWTVPAAG